MDDPFAQSDVRYLKIKKWEQMNSKLRVGFTMRTGGKSKKPYNTLNLGLHVGDTEEKVISNREIVAKEINIPLTQWVLGEQTHETNIKVIDTNHKGRGALSVQTSMKSIDGLITKAEDILCAAFFADCVPLYFMDPFSGYIGIAHAGWKGTVNRMAENMVKQFKNLGVDSRNLLVAIGPCVSQEKYEVDQAIIKKVNPIHRDIVVETQGNNRFLLDLKQLNVEILLQSGILRNNIDITTYCTYTDTNLFFSHRREGKKTGRMLGFIGYSNRKL